MIVIADDITGAAEMAGIAYRLGLRVHLSMKWEETGKDCDVLVIATDTRSMTEKEAVEETQRIASSLKGHTLFKKTDSALRGHVVAELAVLLNMTDYRQALYLPANPSKGRIIRKGVYYIQTKDAEGNVTERPLHETAFSFDPEFPATSSCLAERFPQAQEKNIHWTDATTAEDIRHAVEQADGQTLLAGAADLFTAFLHQQYHHLQPCEQAYSINQYDALMVCGSTQSKPVDIGASIAYMPTAVYDGKASVEDWINPVIPTYQQAHRLILAIQDHHRTGKESAVYLRETTAEAVSSLIVVHRPQELIIEGGATAFAILRKLNWQSFTITNEIAAGVIRMRSSQGTYITMKPGSYPWGGLFQ